MVKIVPGHLPESKKKGFWGKDAEQIICRPEEIKGSKEHVFYQKGHEAICKSCPFVHATYLKIDQEVKDGKIVKKKKVA